MKLLKGATIDYAEEMMREIFYVKENPNAEISCSCKSSFSPKDYVLWFLYIFQFIHSFAIDRL